MDYIYNVDGVYAIDYTTFLLNDNLEEFIPTLNWSGKTERGNNDDVY